MDLLPSPEQTEIIDSSAAFLRDRLPLLRTRELFDAPGGVDEVAWAEAAELGWFGLGLPEDQGGVGGGLADEALLFREIGRSLATGPFLSTVLAARVAALGGKPELAASIVGGQRVGLAMPIELAIVTADGLVDGALQLLDTDGDLVLVATPEAAMLIEVAALSEVESVPCYDPAVRLHRATARGVRPLMTVAAATDAVERRGHVLAAAMLTGITEAVRDLASEHAKNRIQFDRPIGVHQAVKHPCANMAVQAQIALAQTLFAALTVDEDREDAELHALSAHLVSARAAYKSAVATVQVLGGIGFSFEHDAHLYVKRSRVLSLLFGGTDHQLDRLLALPKSL